MRLGQQAVASKPAAILLFFVGEDGSVIRRRALTGVSQRLPPDRTVQSLATTTGGTYLVSPIAFEEEGAMLLRLDDQGDAGCGLVVNANEKLVSRKLVLETLPMDMDRVSNATTAAKPSVEAAKVTVAPMKCSAAQPYAAAKSPTTNIYREPEHDELASQARALLAKKDFAALDKLAATLRPRKRRSRRARGRRTRRCAGPPPASPRRSCRARRSLR